MGPVTMKTLFLTALFHITLPGMLGRGIRLPDELILTNARDQVEKLLSTNFERLVGTIEAGALRDSNCSIFCLTDHSHDFPKDEEEARQLLDERLRQVHLFLLMLWLVKDNSVNVELGFLEYPYGTSHTRVMSNFRAVRYCRADGAVTTTQFSDAEVRIARDLYSHIFRGPCEQDERRGYCIPEDLSRMNRVFYFVQAARSFSDLGAKVAMYITCFESLFCTDSSEMAHKLSERVAFFLADSPAERVKIYGQMKAAYNLRSKVVHGDKISRKIAEQAASICTVLDELLRNTICTILSSTRLQEIFWGSPQVLEDYLTRLVLGEPEAVSYSE
jgi:hypothetical protein